MGNGPRTKNGRRNGRRNVRRPCFGGVPKWPKNGRANGWATKIWPFRNPPPPPTPKHDRRTFRRPFLQPFLVLGPFPILQQASQVAIVEINSKQNVLCKWHVKFQETYSENKLYVIFSGWNVHRGNLVATIHSVLFAQVFGQFSLFLCNENAIFTQSLLCSLFTAFTGTCNHSHVHSPFTANGFLRMFIHSCVCWWLPTQA